MDCKKIYSSRYNESLYLDYNWQFFLVSLNHLLLFTYRRKEISLRIEMTSRTRTKPATKRIEYYSLCDSLNCHACMLTHFQNQICQFDSVVAPLLCSLLLFDSVIRALKHLHFVLNRMVLNNMKLKAEWIKHTYIDS